METIERIRPPAEALTRPPALPPSHNVVEEVGTNSDRKPENRIRPVEYEGRIFQARSSYDAENAEVFIEILNPTTGNVIRRLPAKKAAEDRFVFGQGISLLYRIA